MDLILTSVAIILAAGFLAAKLRAAKKGKSSCGCGRRCQGNAADGKRR